MASDAELIGRSLAGDDDAFVEIVRRHAEAVSAYLVRRVGRGSAEDLLGDIWVAAFVSRASYNQSFDGARPWLFGIARNTLRRHWRTAVGEELMPEMAEIPVVLNPWPELDERIDVDAVLGRELVKLRRALVDLPADQLDLLLLVAWEQLSVAARRAGVDAANAVSYSVG